MLCRARLSSVQPPSSLTPSSAPISSSSPLLPPIPPVWSQTPQDRRPGDDKPRKPGGNSPKDHLAQRVHSQLKTLRTVSLRRRKSPVRYVRVRHNT